MDLFGESPTEPSESDQDPIIADAHMMPDEDCGLKEPKLNTACYGFENQEAQLLHNFNAGQMPHGIILSGPKGIGKSTFAYRLMRFLLVHGTSQDDPNQDALFAAPEPTTPQNFSVDMNAPALRLMHAGAHPDMIVLGEDLSDQKTVKPIINIETIRKINPFLHKTASEGGWRIVMIDNADTMTVQAQNAVLKVLEEPPTNTLIVLIAHRAGALIPTIRSRSRLIPCYAPAKDDFKTILRSHEDGEALSLEQIGLLALLSDSRPGYAIQIIEQNGLDVFEESMAMLSKGNTPEQNIEIHRFADTLSRKGKENAYDAFENSMLFLAQTLTMAKAKHPLSPIEGLDLSLQNYNLETLLNHYTLEEWIKICDILRDHFERVRLRNLDKRHGVMGAFSALAA
jgi:DNA polymerase-3 subunit delta'